MIDTTDAEGALDVLMRRLDAATAQAVAEGALEIEALAKTVAPVKTGHLRRSIETVGPYPDGPGAYSANVGPTVVYGRLRELGGHIYPVHRQALRWEGPNGESVFAMHVYQGPRPYLKPSTERVRQRFDAICLRRWTAAIESVNA